MCDIPCHTDTQIQIPIVCVHSMSSFVHSVCALWVNETRLEVLVIAILFVRVEFGELRSACVIGPRVCVCVCGAMITQSICLHARTNDTHKHTHKLKSVETMVVVMMMMILLGSYRRSYYMVIITTIKIIIIIIATSFCSVLSCGVVVFFFLLCTMCQNICPFSSV